MKEIIVAFLIMVTFCFNVYADDLPNYEVVSDDSRMYFVDAAANENTTIVISKNGMAIKTNDFENWEIVKLPMISPLKAITYDGEKFVIAGAECYFVSADGDIWETSTFDGVMERTDSGGYRMYDASSNKMFYTNASFTASATHRVVNGKTMYFSFDKLNCIDSGGTTEIDYNFENPLEVAYSDNVYRVFGYKDGNITVYSSDDLTNWREETYFISYNIKTELYFVPRDDGTEIFFGDCYSNSLNKVILQDDGSIENCKTDIPNEFYDNCEYLNGNIIFLKGNKITVEPGGGGCKIYTYNSQPSTDNQANSISVYWSGREWFIENSVIASEQVSEMKKQNAIENNKFDISEEMKNWYTGKSLKFRYFDDSYIAFTTNIPRDYITDSSRIYKISGDLNTVPDEYTTPGYVLDIMKFNNKFYITVPGVNFLSGEKKVYSSNNLTTWTEEPLFELPLYSSFGAKNCIVPSYAEEEAYLTAINMDDNKNKIVFEKMQFDNITVLNDIYYAFNQNNTNTEMFVSKDGIYWTYLSLPFVPNVNLKVYEEDGIISIVSETPPRNEIAFPKEEIHEKLSSVDKYIMVNETILGFENPPVVEKDRMIVPMRFLFEMLGAEVLWNDETKTATAFANGNSVAFSINSSVAVVNGVPVPMEISARLINDKTMVPLRFLSEKLGYIVEWDEKNNTAVIKQDVQ